MDPHQFLGIEINPRAASITELVLWIGYLQWHFRTYGNTMPPEPILKQFKNIECRDAVLAWDGEPEPKRDEHGNILTVWDRRSYKTDQVTGREIPDESKRVTLLIYKNARPADWPNADYIVGNPPYLGASRMREDLGDGYAETLRSTYPEIPEGADYVMFWWSIAASKSRGRGTKRFGFITTNKIRQTFARKVLDLHMEANPPLSIVFAIPDHPWVDTIDGADVRVAMTVGAEGDQPGDIDEVVSESPTDDGEQKVILLRKNGRINSDLTIGAAVAEAEGLHSNEALSSQGMKLHGQGFLVTRTEAAELGLGRLKGLETHMRPFAGSRDIAQTSRDLMAMDFDGLTAENLRQHYPECFQWLYTKVKPERDSNNEEYRRLNWWLFGRRNTTIRRFLKELDRYLLTPRTAKHRIFTFVPGNLIPESETVAIGLDDPFFLGVLSSRIHEVWSLAQCGWMGVGNDPRYNNTRCFETFAFPDCTEPQRDRIRKIAEELDAHRKRVQAQHPGLTLTGMYNVLEKLRASQPLTLKEKEIHDKGLVSVLKQLHDDLDVAVFDAYGWPTPLTDAEILERLVALNAERAREESQGLIRWLRPDYQIPLFSKNTPNLNLGTSASSKAPKSETSITQPKIKKVPWPKSMAERAKAVESILKSAEGPVAAAELAKNFKAAKPEAVAEILETLCTLGHARKGKEKGTFIA